MIVRYADDIVVGFAHEVDARRFWDAMRKRFEEFALSLHPEKTRLIEFGRQAADRRDRRGLTGGMMIVRYADDSVPRTHRRKKVRNCVRDGGRSSGAGRQGQASNHRKLRRSKAGVVSVAEKAGLDPVRYGSERRARANR
jgi:hypothetical protein